MNDLKNVLQQAEHKHAKLGGSMSVTVKAALNAHRRRQFRIFVTFEVIVVVVMLICVGLLAFGRINDASLKSIAGVVGIGAGGGGFEIVRRIWRDWSQTDLLLLLINGATDAQVKSLTDKLIAKL